MGLDRFEKLYVCWQSSGVCREILMRGELSRVNKYRNDSQIIFFERSPDL
jgi:hypothetical protein